MPEGMVALHLASLAFDASVSELFGPLSTGGRLILASEEVRRSLLALMNLMQSHGVELANLPPSTLPHLDLGRLGTLRTLLVGGEATSPHAAVNVAQRCRLMNGYGPTEASIACSYWEGDPSGCHGASLPIGRPIANTRIHVVDATGVLSPVGVPGELHIAGLGLARGYLGRPGLTAERFVPDPFGPPGTRMYRTGDLCRWRADGNLEFLGRLDHQVKVRGYRIELGEIEAALSAQPGVSLCVVVAREDGPGGKQLVAYLVGEALPEIEALRGSLRSQLPEWMVPSAFVTLDALPLTPNGKVDRKSLPAPDLTRTDALVLPRTEPEAQMASLWSSILGVAHVSVTDDFFALGGHSLLLTQLASRVRAELGVEVPLRALFEARTLEAQAVCVQSAQASALAPLVAVPRDRRLAQSFAQARLWFLEQLNPGTAEYNIPMAFALRGPLDAGALRAALQEIVSRHEVLRTTLGQDEAGPVQRVGPRSAWGWRVQEVGSAEEAERLLAEEAARPFDLERGPVLRVSLVRLGEAEHRLLLSVHHVAFDGACISVLLRELGEAYAAHLEGRAPALPPLPIQIADVAAWERQALSGEALEARLAPWRERLADAPVLELPTDRPRPPMRAVEGAFEAFEVDAEVLAGLEALALRAHCTRFMVLLAAFQLLLSRLSGQQDLVVGAPVAGRTRAETEGLIGLFVNTLALRVDLSGDPSFVELLARVRESVLFATSHQDLPFEQLVDAVVTERDTSRTPLVQAMFTLEEASAGPEALGEATFEPIDLATDIAKFDLSLSMRVTEQGLEGGLEYATALFDPETARRWAGHLVTLLRGIADDPERRLSELPILSEPERHQLLVEWNDTAAPAPELPIHALFEQQVLRSPEATALVFEEQSLTYAELNARANRLAWELQRRGVGRGDRVAVLLERSLELVVGLYGILKAGGAYVPVEPTLPRQRIHQILEDCGALIALVGPGAPDGLPLTTLEVSLAGEGSLEFTSSAGADDVAYVIYTSGSTGRPKGVANAHRGVANRLHWMQQTFPLGAEDAVLQKTPSSFDVSVWEFFWPLLVGARLVLARPEGHKDPHYLVELIQEQDVTTLHFVPSMLSAFLEVRGVEGCTSLRRVICSGEALSPQTRDHFFQRSRAKLHNLYGPTEAAIDVTWWPCLRGAPPGSVPIGAPITNVQVYVLRDGDLCPVGVPGELMLCGVQLAVGYLGRPGLTAERFVPNPFGPPGSRMYRTGDLCRWRTDGNLEFLGRLDHQVKVRGYRIELGEIEAVLSAQPRVSQCVVVAREGAAGKQLVAYLVGEALPKIEALRASLQSSLPEWMVPSAFVTLDALPLTPNGKVDRRALPAPSSERSERSFTPPRTATEALLAQIWSEVLGVQHVGVDDRFFELGGDSILALKVVSAATRAGLVMTVRDLFAFPDLHSLADFLDGGEAQTGAARCLLRLRAGDGERPLVCVAPLGGAVHSYRHLARALRESLPIWVLEAPEVAGLDVSPDTLTELAALHVRELMAALPALGAVRLIGYSFGGPLAVEVARLLRERGMVVASLILIDPPTPGARVEARGQLGFLALHVGLAPEEVAAMELDAAISRIAACLAEQGDAPSGRAWEEEVRRIGTAAERNRARFRSWQPRSPNVPTLLMRAEEEVGADDTRWRALLGEAQKTAVIPGDHFSCVREPLVQDLARQLEAHLDAAPPVPGRQRIYRSELTDSTRWERFKPRPGDVFVCTMEKHGTTWTQTLCAMLLAGRSELPAPLAELSPWFDGLERPVEEAVALLEAQYGRRVIKTHTPLDGLPYYPQCTYIAVYRDPRDAFFSLADHAENMKHAERANKRRLLEPEADFQEWVQARWPVGLQGAFALEETLHHYRSFLQHAGLTNVHLFHYAELKRDLPGALQRLTRALGIEADEHLIEQITAATDLQRMRRRAADFAPGDASAWGDVGQFFKQGRLGGWRERLSEVSVRAFEERLAEGFTSEEVDWLLSGERRG
ncbi:MAG: amino acid adenylation domain-containing protein [Alphaproteobacteria bacterium]|nr:amino acid adenylation domain-containing protein [Alphaproteobacteria bacterium]